MWLMIILLPLLNINNICTQKNHDRFKYENIFYIYCKCICDISQIDREESVFLFDVQLWNISVMFSYSISFIEIECTYQLVQKWHTDSICSPKSFCFFLYRKERVPFIWFEHMECILFSNYRIIHRTYFHISLLIFTIYAKQASIIIFLL